MSTEPLTGLVDEALAGRLALQAAGDLPVLRATADEMARMQAAQERVAAAALAGAILRDPLMSLKVLRFLFSHRTRSQTTDITTIAHAIMMLGHARFFREFEALPVLEDRLDAAALDEARALMSRSRLAALFARDWAQQRHDIDPEEVMVAALLHDVPELLCLLEGTGPVPREALPAELRQRVFERLEVPGLVAVLNDEGEAHNPRIVNVQLACRLARHCHDGWPAAAVQADLAEVQRFLRSSEPQSWERVRRVVLAAAREWHYYGILPAAASMPFVIPEPAELAPDVRSPRAGTGMA